MNYTPLYKFVPTKEIAQKVSTGIYRFYELTKYKKIEESTGRADLSEGSISFTKIEVDNHIEKLPIGSFNGIEFFCENISLSDEYLRQYFVFCMSTTNDGRAISDCSYSVELATDIFDIFEILLPTPKSANSGGAKFFSHSPVEYYDIHNHPKPSNGELWKEVYLKHSDFSYQHEYRAAMFVSDHFFERVRNDPAIYEREIRDDRGNPCDFSLKLVIRSGVDETGWRYIEFDVSEFQANISPEPSKILIRER